MCDSQTQTDNDDAISETTDTTDPDPDLTKKCLVCLTEDVEVHPIKNSKLTEIYDRLGLEIPPQEGEVQTLCYTCMVDVQRCRRFYSNVHKCDKMLKELFIKGTQPRARRQPGRVAILWRTRDPHEASGWRQLRIYREGAPVGWPRFIAHRAQDEL